MQSYGAGQALAELIADGATANSTRARSRASASIAANWCSRSCTFERSDTNNAPTGFAPCIRHDIEHDCAARRCQPQRSRRLNVFID